MTPYSPAAIAKEAARKCVDEFYRSVDGDHAERLFTPIILTAAARMVRESGAVEALENLLAKHSCADRSDEERPEMLHGYAALANLKRLT